MAVWLWFFWGRLRPTMIICSPDAQPICLPDPTQDYINVTTEITGWGETDQVISKNSEVLKEANLTTLANSQCSDVLKKLKNQQTITDNMICAEGPDANVGKIVGPCRGDSGGPMITLKENTGRYDQIGITSYVIQAPLKNGTTLSCVFSVFSRVTAQLDWINKMIKRQ